LYKQYQLEGTHRVRTHAVLLLTLTLTFDLSAPNHTTCRISPAVHQRSFPIDYQVWTLCCHSFLSYAADKQTNRQTDSTIIVYPRRPTESPR